MKVRLKLKPENEERRSLSQSMGTGWYVYDIVTMVSLRSPTSRNPEESVYPMIILNYIAEGVGFHSGSKNL
jgi:hypothetical protein